MSLGEAMKELDRLEAQMQSKLIAVSFETSNGARILVARLSAETT